MKENKYHHPNENVKLDEQDGTGKSELEDEVVKKDKDKVDLTMEQTSGKIEKYEKEDDSNKDGDIDNNGVRINDDEYKKDKK